MGIRKGTAVTTSKLKLRAPSKSKASQLNNALAAYSTALLELLKRAKERFDPEEFIVLTKKKGESTLTSRSLQVFTTWVNRELSIKQLRLNCHLKLGLIYHLSSILRTYTACFIEDVDTIFPFSNYMAIEETPSLDSVLSEALACVTLEQEKYICSGLLKKRDNCTRWPLHLTSKDSFGIYWATKNNRYYVSLPINQAPQKRGRRSQKSPLDLHNILEDVKPVTDGPWVYFPLAMGRRDRDLLLEVEKFRSLGRQSRSKMSKPLDIGACALQLKEDKYYLEVSVRHVQPIAETKNIIAISLTPYAVTYMVMDHRGTLIASSQFGRKEMLHRVLSHDKVIALKQQSGLSPTGRFRRHLLSTVSHAITNYLVSAARKHNARVILHDQKGRKKEAQEKRKRTDAFRTKRRERIISLWDYSRILRNLEYKLIIEGLPRPFIFKKNPTRICTACQKVLSNKEINWQDRLCVCEACKHSESVDFNAAASMILSYKRIVASKRPLE